MTVQQKLRAKSTGLLLSIEVGLPRIMTIWFALAMLACALRIAVSPMHAAPDFRPSCLMCCWSARRSSRWAWRSAGSTMATGCRSRRPPGASSAAGATSAGPRRSAIRFMAAAGSWSRCWSECSSTCRCARSNIWRRCRRLPAACRNGCRRSTLVMTLDVVLLTQPLYDRLRRGAAPRAAVPAPARRDLGDRHRHAARHRHGRCRHRGPAADVADALHTLLDGNVKKVLISVCLWLPYLLLSKRVNVTYRHRVDA